MTCRGLDWTTSVRKNCKREISTTTTTLGLGCRLLTPPPHFALRYCDVHGELRSFEVKSADRKAPKGWDIPVVAHMPSKGITTVMQSGGGVLSTEVACQCDHMLINVNKTFSTDPHRGILDAQEAMGGVLYVGKDCTTTRPPGVRCSVTPQRGEKMNRRRVKLHHVVTSFKDQEPLTLDPGASPNFYCGGTGIWNLSPPLLGDIAQH